MRQRSVTLARLGNPELTWSVSETVCAPARRADCKIERIVLLRLPKDKAKTLSWAVIDANSSGTENPPDGQRRSKQSYVCKPLRSVIHEREHEQWSTEGANRRAGGLVEA